MSTKNDLNPWGVLMLDTQFPRYPGDIGCPLGWPVALMYQKVSGMFPQDIVRTPESLKQHQVLPAFVKAGRQLVDQGAKALTTSCGFLVLLQRELQEALPVPVRTSSLLLLPKLLAMYQTVGVLTMDESALSEAHFWAAGVMPQDMSRLRVQGVDRQSVFAHAIMGNCAQMDFEAAQQSVLSAAMRLKQKAPDLKHVVLECTNMPPYAGAIELATGWQLHSLHQLLTTSSAEASK
jgi:hypothetical protein